MFAFDVAGLALVIDVALTVPAAPLTLPVAEMPEVLLPAVEPPADT